MYTQEDVFHLDTSIVLSRLQPLNIRLISVTLFVFQLETFRLFSFAQFMNMP